MLERSPLALPVGLLAAALLVAALFASRCGAGGDEATLRAVFHVPDDVALDVSLAHNRFGHHEIRAVGDLTPQQVDAFLRRIDEGAFGQPVPFALGDTTYDGLAQPGALRWQDGDAGAVAGAHWLDWGGLYRSGIHDVSTGSMLSMCAVVVAGRGGGNEWVPCHDATSRERQVVVRAALDGRSRRLYALISR